MTEIEQNVIEAARAVAKWNEENGQVNRLTGFQNLTLLEALVAAVNDYNAAQVPTTDGTQPRVHASAHDDEYYHEVPAFDCTPWFEQAADEDIVTLANCNFGGDYAADAVAGYFENNNNYPEIVAMFQYKKTGFECYVNEAESVTWLRTHRPYLVHKNPAYPNDEDAYEIGLPKWRRRLD